MTEYVVFLSGGVTSFEALRRMLLVSKDVTALFSDVKGERDTDDDVTGEDKDTYRFLDDIERLVWPIVRIRDGRNIWEVFRDTKFIGNTRIDPCSRVLKRELCGEWMMNNKPDAVVVLGLDWSEPHRIESSEARWKAKGFDCYFPLSEKPYLLKAEYMAKVREAGIEPPRLYKYGFEHNNCGGACVKGGQGQWTRLLYTNPDRYKWNEEQEEITRKHIGADVSILRSRIGGKTCPLTLRELRERIESGQQPEDDIFSCNCMG